MHLTRRGFVLASLALLLGAVGLWAGVPFAGAWRFPAALLLVALLAEGWWAQRLPLQARWLPGARPRLGRSEPLRLELQHAGARALDLQLYLGAPLAVRAQPAIHLLRIAPGASCAVAESFVPLALGALAWPAAQARLRGRFGLGWWTRRLEAPPEQRVVPDALGADWQAAPGRSGGPTALRRRGHGLELLGLRDYVAGDALRSLDWKASARSARLIVRDTAEEQHLEVALVIDAGRAGLQRAGALTRLHHFVNVAARFAERAALLGDRLALVVLCGSVRLRLAPQAGAAGLRRLRAALQDLRAQALESNPVEGALAVRRLLHARALVVWLGDIGQGEDEGMAQAARLLAAKHLPLFVQLLDDEVLAERERPAQAWLDPYVALAAAQTLEQQARARSRLARLGCEVVAARPAQVEAQLVSRYLQLRADRRV